MLWLRLVLLFTLLPFIELVLLLWIGSKAGLLPTIALVLGTGLIGAAAARWQGLATLRRIQEQVARGQMPGVVLLDGLMILIAAVLLMAPGVLTDLLGFALLVPWVREQLQFRFLAWLKEWAMIQVRAGSKGPGSGGPGNTKDIVLDAEFTRHPADERREDS
jgi:UPF0716 protein FxsA